MQSSLENQQRTFSDSDLCAASTGKTYNKKFLINKLNYINFVDGTITATFRHYRYLTTVALQVKPLPCSDEKVVCLWTDTESLKQTLQTHDFLHLLICDGHKTLIVEPEAVEVSEQALEILLPHKCTELTSRKIRRHACRDIDVQLVQNGTFFQGVLVNFSAVSVNIKLFAKPPQTFQWINTSVPASLVFSNHQGTVFTGEFKITSQTCGQNERSLVLALRENEIRKFKPKKYRSNRECLLPAPNIHFTHPLTGRQVDLKSFNVSGSGFSVEEDSYNSLLLPGLILPEAQLVFADGGRLNCKAQVIYRKECDTKKGRVKCGIAILDMQIEDQVKLLDILNQVHNSQSYVSNQIDLDALWKFFFETGFIYPQKYAFIESKKAELKDTYQKIYNDRPNIARHFIYQDNGVILAHMAMIRFYRKAWMIHHHAAQKQDTKKGGLTVLSHISRYANELHRLYSAHLDFVFCYFRPNNRFPKRVFGGVAEYINDSKGCSVDSFAYFHYSNSFSSNWEVSESWSLNRACREDLLELNSFLEHHSGGLMVTALDMEPDCKDDSDLSKEFESLGLKRERHLFSFKIKGSLKAIVIVNLSDMGLNMSDLTNCFKIIVLDSEGLNRDLLYLLLSMLSVKFKLGRCPVLMYPYSFAETINIPIEKEYVLWILNLQYLDSYFEYCENIIPDF